MCIGDRLVEGQAFVVIRADPGHRVHDALFERGVGFRNRHRDGRRAQPRQHVAGESARLHFQAAQIVDGLDFAAEPAAHLGAGIAAGKVQDVVLVEQYACKRLAFALRHPCVHLPRIQSERHAGIEAKRRVGIEVSGGRRVAAVDDAVLHGLEHLPRLHQVAGGVYLDTETSIGDVGHIAGDVLRDGKQRGRFIGKTGGQSPCDRGGFLRENRGRQGGAAGGGAQGGLLQKRAASHGKGPPSCAERCRRCRRLP
ncbi:hypothetical protein D9M68_541190 [compost metagenome]